MEPTQIDKLYKVEAGPVEFLLHITHVKDESDPLLTIAYNSTRTMHLNNIRYSHFLEMVDAIKEIVGSQ